MTTNPTRPRPGYLDATQLGNGTYVVRSGVCCRPEACAPAVGVRCCPSVRCDCPLPVRWAREPEKPSRVVQGLQDRRALLRVAGWTSAGVTFAGAMGGIAWGVFQAVAWVVEHAVLIAGGAAGVGLLLVLLGRPGGGSSRTFSGTFRGQMD